MSYNVKLDVFEGPLDLLLFFIKRDEINIYDIPISYITREYLDYMQIMKQLNLHLAGEFIIMAALLMRIKAQMLLPQREEEQLEEVEDPRTELVQMLVEYQKYKQASEFLREFENQQRRLHTVNAETAELDFDPDIFLGDVNLIDLALAFKQLIAEMPKPTYYEIEQVKINIRQQSRVLRSLFANRIRIRFSDILKNLDSRIELVVTFLALLEMIKMHEVGVTQHTIYGDFWISKRKMISDEAIADA